MEYENKNDSSKTNVHGDSVKWDTPKDAHSKDQVWFWSDQWQTEEQEAEQDILSGNVSSFTNVNDLFKDLDKRN
ncbi:hypothetical protein ACFO0S_08340 [Chryseomicrobium palamuruense]|uniref:Uncharacterized protein n=1 Tax=Chryseomicrobium palamuruense TaxID=682973 RepID=A0ABV8UUQ6_9BACL